MHKLGSQAIVIGAGIGGLIAARMLADYYRQVIVLERDTLPGTAEPRRGVPHGRHAHGLLARGREALETMFPGLTADLIAAGAVPIDTLADSRWFSHGVYFANGSSGLRSMLLSRPMLELHVRRRLLAYAGVSICERALVQSLVGAGASITGVILSERIGGLGPILSAELIVDASGRHSRSPAWLQELGYERPHEDLIEVDIGYSTRLLRRRREHLGGKAIALIGAQAPAWRFGVAIATEQQRWIVTQGGYFEDRPADGESGFLDFARTLAAPDIAELLAAAEPLTPVANFAFPASRRWRYERLIQFPDGYLVFGDALCSFNPIYGQGMTAAALQGLILGACLTAGDASLARRFFAQVRPIVDIPWQIAAGADFRHPRLAHLQGAAGRFTNWYIGKVHRAAARDWAVGQAFMQVTNLIDAPTKLFAPKTISKVLLASLRRPSALGSMFPDGLEHAG